MKTSLAFSLLFSIYVHVHSQEIDSIDLIFKECIDSSYGSTYDYINCLGDALTAWDSELNIIYKKIISKLSESEAEKFRAAQRKWIEYRDAEIIFIEQFYDREGKGWQVEASAREVELTKQRVLELRYYYSLIYDE